MNTPPVLIAKRMSDNAELFCLPNARFSDNGLIRTKDGATMPVAVVVALEKMPFFLYDPSKITEPYRRAVLERIQSGEAYKDWLSGSGLKIDVPPPQPEQASPDKKSPKGEKPKKNDNG